MFDLISPHLQLNFRSIQNLERAFKISKVLLYFSLVYFTTHNTAISQASVYRGRGTNLIGFFSQKQKTSTTTIYSWYQHDSCCKKSGIGVCTIVFLHYFLVLGSSKSNYTLSYMLRCKYSCLQLFLTYISTLTLITLALYLWIYLKIPYFIIRLWNLVLILQVQIQVL